MVTVQHIISVYKILFFFLSLQFLVSEEEFFFPLSQVIGFLFLSFPASRLEGVNGVVFI